MPLASALLSFTIPATEKHTATVVLVHGLGDTGKGLKTFTDALRSDPGLSHVKWVLPHSPTRPVTASAGEVMPSWFDIYSFGFDGEEDENGMLRASRQLSDIIHAEIDEGTDPSRIVIGGFSQGGAMSLLTGLTSEKKLGGVAVLSGWLPLRERFQNMMKPHATSTPIFWGHGTTDPLVGYHLCRSSVDHLTRNCGMPVAQGTGVNGIKCKVYEGMAHISCPQELDDLKTWFKAVIPKGGR